MILTKKKGKSSPIKIDGEFRQRISSFKKRLREMAANDEVSEEYKTIIKIILKELDPYDLNILIAYFEFKDAPRGYLSKRLGVSSSVINNRINKILKYVHSRANLPDDDCSFYC